jgi:hypothetical protein
MERESTGTKYMIAYCEGSQGPPSVQLRKKKKYCYIISFSITFVNVSIFQIHKVP